MPTPLAFDGGLTCSLSVADLKRSVDWYQSVLGFKVLYVKEDIGWCEMSTHIPRVNLGVGQVEKPEVRGGATLVWGVKDLDHDRRQLEARKVRFDGETQTIPGLVKLATFFDPDGNKHMLYQDLSGH